MLFRSLAASGVIEGLPTESETDAVMFERNRGGIFYFVAKREYRAASMRENAVDRAIVG